MERWPEKLKRNTREYAGDNRYPMCQRLVVIIGHRLLVSKTHGKELLNGAFVVVQELDDTGITVRDCETGAETTVPHDRLQEHFLSARAICYATCQAKTIEGTIALRQTGHPHFTRRCLLVGLSRGRAKHLVTVK